MSRSPDQRHHRKGEGAERRLGVEVVHAPARDAESRVRLRRALDLVLCATVKREEQEGLVEPQEVEDG